MPITQLKVCGLASGNETLLPSIMASEHTMTLLQYLEKHSLPIASSCSGEGVCEKCQVNKDLLSCQITLSKYLCDCEKDPLNVNLGLIKVNYL